MSELTLVLDPGASLSKIFYSVDAGPPAMLLMPPEIITTTEESVNDGLAAAIAKVPDDKQAWVQWGKEVWAVGQLARDLKATARMNGLKWEPALYKLLAAVGVIVRRETLREPINLKLGVLLPFGEYKSHKEFEQEIHNALSDFKFQHQRISVNLKKFHCRPEGAGLLASRCDEIGSDRLNKVIAVLAIGFRNATYLLSTHGAKAKGETTTLGFHTLLDSIIQRTDGQTYTSLIKPVYLAGFQVQAQALESLPRTQNPKRRKAELLKIVEGVRLANAEYWRAMVSWLTEVLPPDIDEIVLAGGTAEFLKKILVKQYGQNTIKSVAELEKAVKLAFPNATCDLVPRLTDGYAQLRILTKEPVLHTKK